MTTARTAILARVRAAQRTALLPGPHHGGPEPQSARAPHDLESVQTRFEQEVEALGVEVLQAGSADALRTIVRNHTAGRRVLSWDREWLPHDAFEGLTDPLTGAAPRELLAAAEIGVTACDAAVADTGSLVLLSGQGRARTVSLLPPTHLAIVRRDDIVPTLADAFQRLNERLCGAASCTVITGPSRTADIELTLTLGIHGPGRLIVVICP